MDLKRPEDYYIKKLLQTVKLKEIMTFPVVFLHVDDPFSQIPQKFSSHNIRHLPILDQHEHVVGVITQRDLYKIISPHKLEDGGWSYDKDMLEGEILSKVMTKNPLTMSPEDSVGKALLDFVRTKYGCFPVVDQHMYLKGIVTQIDILKIAAKIFLE